MRGSGGFGHTPRRLRPAVFVIFGKEAAMNNIIWLVGAVVIVVAILSFLGLA
ncbi:hypothetical protein QO005_003025 [Rhizobium paknamense]|uniref:Uncharacterized protein n=1 Tax=Rhizobium paknamense TaxID=1206817 RepID=A0ABU0IGC9_9HYPH|nr:hypothetical protein [Rhizobium paknamense]